MKLQKAGRRDKKRTKKNKMVVGSKSVFVIQEVLIKKSEKVKEKNVQKIKSR